LRCTQCLNSTTAAPITVLICNISILSRLVSLASWPVVLLLVPSGPCRGAGSDGGAAPD
jgi:hypothetical protein